jgi:creatinine amidohydrolase
VESLVPHGFTKFFVINGHGGNTEPNGIAMRELKARYPNLTFGHSGYFAYATDAAAQAMKGPLREIRHACEAEASLGLYLFPELVRKDLLRDDGLAADPAIKGLVLHFDEITEEGSYGYATLATADKGKAIFEAAVEGATREMRALANGFVLKGLDPKP